MIGANGRGCRTADDRGGMADEGYAFRQRTRLPGRLEGKVDGMRGTRVVMRLEVIGWGFGCPWSIGAARFA